MNADTIAAIATAPGAGAVAVVRISGPNAAAVLGAVFHPSARDPVQSPRRLVHGRVVGPGGETRDEVLAVFMPGPHSFTGEDVAELQGHGGPAVARSVLDAVLAAGARQAGPGEFTKRAFMAGKLDLAQAEAVAELVGAKTGKAAHLALNTLGGHLGRRVAAMRRRLTDLRARICLAVDFPEEETEFVDLGGFAAEIDPVLDEIDKMLADYRRAAPVRDGALAVLAGAVNAGKSSLLNALLGRERAIVAATPGTTRDYIEETLDLSGLAVRLIDTAGLRAQAGEVELLGMDKSLALLDSADLAVLVVDRAIAASSETRRDILKTAARRGPAGTLVAANKADLEPSPDSVLAALAAGGFEIVPVSAKTGLGLPALCARVRARILDAGGGEPDPDTVAPNMRQSAALAEAKEELRALLADLKAGAPPDCLGVRLQTACDTLAAITGEITPEGVLETVFSRFCIGK